MGWAELVILMWAGHIANNFRAVQLHCQALVLSRQIWVFQGSAVRLQPVLSEMADSSSEEYVSADEGVGEESKT